MAFTSLTLIIKSLKKYGSDDMAWGLLHLSYLFKIPYLLLIQNPYYNPKGFCYFFICYPPLHTIKF